MHEGRLEVFQDCWDRGALHSGRGPAERWIVAGIPKEDVVDIVVEFGVHMR